MTDFSLADKAAELTIKEFGQIDGVVINHGMLLPVTRIVDSKLEEWKHHFDVNFLSAVAFVSPSDSMLVKSCSCHKGPSDNTSASEDRRLSCADLFWSCCTFVYHLGRLRSLQSRPDESWQNHWSRGAACDYTFHRTWRSRH